MVQSGRKFWEVVVNDLPRVWFGSFMGWGVQNGENAVGFVEIVDCNVLFGIGKIVNCEFLLVYKNV